MAYSAYKINTVYSAYPNMAYLACSTYLANTAYYINNIRIFKIDEYEYKYYS